MLNKTDRQIVINNVRKSITNNYQDITDFDKWTTKEINKEIVKVKTKYNNNKKVIIYDTNFNTERDSKISIIFEDFIGKNKRLNVFNSCEKVNIVRSNSKNINELNGIFYRKALFNLTCFFTNFSFFSKKNIKFFFTFFFNYLFLSIYNILILLFFTAFNIINYFTFLIYKLLLIIEYKIFKRFHLKFLNIFLILPIIIIKQILILFKEIANFLSNIFSIINNTFKILNKNFNNSLYSSIITAPVNRDQRTNEHKNILDKTNKKAKEIFNKYNLENDYFIEKYIFTKVSYKPFVSKIINNSVLKEYAKTVEEIEIESILKSVKKKIETDIKRKIYRQELSAKKQIIEGKSKKIFDCDRNINKYLKKIIDFTNIDTSVLDIERNLKKDYND